MPRTGKAISGGLAGQEPGKEKRMARTPSATGAEGKRQWPGQEGGGVVLRRFCSTVLHFSGEAETQGYPPPSVRVLTRQVCVNYLFLE